jgi:hypothetical protein
MNQSLKHLLLWLLIAVLPLQGFAAVTLHGATIPAPPGMAMPAMDHAAMAIPAHEACIEAPATGSKSPHGCSASGACCVGAAVPPGLPGVTLPPDAPDVHHISVITPVAGHIPDGLERPPRFFSI